MINSPLNYTGNKFKLLKQIMPYLNNEANKFVDVFAGSGLVGLNSDCQEIILNDNNNITIELLTYFKENTADNIIKSMDKIIEEYGFTDTYRKGNQVYIEEKHEGLSRYNKEAFNRLKGDYNRKPSIEKLFALTIYGFNHYIRFNAKGNYNVPVGKVDYSNSLREKTKEYTEAFKKKEVKILNYDFRDKNLYQDTKAIYYFDPPYLITEAPYNNKWSEEDERALLQLLDDLNKRNVKFALSNVLESNGKENKLLKDWCTKYNVFNMDRKYLNANYRKKNITVAKEVLITNYKKQVKEEVKMGTSGNNPGYKVFSISTTVRNPRRNTEFLEVLKDFNHQELTVEVKNKIYEEFIRGGIYRLSKLANTVKKKYQENVLLSDEEILEMIRQNPQKTGNAGRVMTQIRALKDTGLVNLNGKRNKKTLEITPLGEKLLNREKVEDIYAKAMIGLHANNPQRTTIYNEARPFLNTLFTINEINQLEETKKGILWHEFAVFVLSMRDCDYQKIVNEIMTYREKYGKEINQEYLENYLYNKVYVNEIEFESILQDYADDVYRKFNMTGLIDKSGFGNNVYIRFNEYNLSKVKAILKEYANYEFKKFSNTEEYTEFLTSIVLPWQVSDTIKEQMIQEKKNVLGVTIDEGESLDEQIEKLDSIYYKKLFEGSVEKIDTKVIKKELLILSRNPKQKSKYDEIPEPLRLEWLIALATAKIYGAKYVKPNLTLDQEGIPKSYASGGKADIELITEDLYCLIEVTMQKDYKQQENNETTSISDHLRELNVSQDKCSLLIAPRIHHRVVDYFSYCVERNQLAILATTIEKYIEILEENETIQSFKEQIKETTQEMIKTDIKEYCDQINNYRI